MSRIARRREMQFFRVFAALLIATAFLLSSALVADDASGVRVPEGFEATLFADDDLAHDIYSMTIDSLGRVVVSGAGYVRILIDTDGDGKADSFKQYADGPKTGAQGMYFHGRDLICTGDAGLIRYRDRDGDDRADGPPDVFLKIKSGGEHHAHAIRRGPDGWWYLIAGNDAGVDEAYATLPTSPIKKPENGTILRLKPDLSGGEIIADGFRNAYDFAFNPQGDIFTFDSDGERDVSLPWYRPTRVFHALPGSNAGWFSRSWKRPDYFFDMPPVVASFGRGSPTGVECYQHTQFPREYDGALFVLDWTFGRVMAMPMQRDGAVWKTEPIEFMTNVGQFGFAPTDAEVGPDGSLYVSVGGRGTRGGVFRVRYAAGQTPDDAAPTETDNQKLAACLTAPQPLSSWSRARWMPLAKELGSKRFVSVALDVEFPAGVRMRAIEILTEMFGGLDAATAKRLAFEKVPAVRARAAWSVGRTASEKPDTTLISLYLNGDDPLTARFALEALLGAGEKTDFGPLRNGLARQLNVGSRFQRQTAAKVLARMHSSRASDYILTNASEVTRDQAQVAHAFGTLDRINRAQQEVILEGLKPALEMLRNTSHPAELRLEAARFVQLALGDVGPGKDRPPVYDSYACQRDLTPYERQVNELRVALAGVYPSGERDLDRELGRLIAMSQPANPRLLDAVLSPLSNDSHPVDDIHQLIVASRIPVERNDGQRARIASALVNLEPKIAARKLNQDSNWDDRISEMFVKLLQYDPKMPAIMLKHPEFGWPGHVTFLNELPREYLQPSIASYVKRVEADGDYPWNTDVVYLLGESDVPAHREIIREQFDNFAVRDVVLIVLARNPDAGDRGLFVQGLESSQLDVLAACVAALGKLPAADDANEQLALLQLMRRLGGDKREFPLRDKVVELLQRNTGLKFGYVSGADGQKPQPSAVAEWTAALTKRYPAEAARQLGASQNEIEQLEKQLAEVDWNAGDLERGRKLFQTRQCAQCHGGRRALGPDLAGVAKRFSRDDLFTAIALPNRDVSPRYQTTQIQTSEGKVYEGLIVYESVDGVTIRDSRNRTFRIEADDIEFRRTLNRSLMPNGLLKDLKPQDLADLNAFIRGQSG